MRLGERIAERRVAKGLSQSELARRARVSQGTIGKLEAGISSGSSFLHRIARALETTPEYLEGELDDPELNAPLAPQRGPQVVMLGVVLPPERALARMFDVLLGSIPEGTSRDEQARLLAQRLPIGLSQLRDLLPDEVSPARPLMPAEALAIAHSEEQR